MRRSLFVSDGLRDLLRSLPPLLKKKVRCALDEIISDPLCGKALIGDLDGFRSYKLGSFRIVYRADHAAITLVAIGPRFSIYEKAAIEVKRQGTCL